MVLNDLFTVLDMDNSIVGMANKNPNQNMSSIQCLGIVACVGMQQASDTLNVCVDPTCSDYYFFVFEPDTKSCILSSSFHVLCGLLIACFLLVEMGVNETVILLTNKVYRTVTNS